MGIQRTEDEIYDQLNLAAEGEDRGSKWPGMSYEQGVSAALRWAIGDSDDTPMEDS